MHISKIEFFNIRWPHNNISITQFVIKLGVCKIYENWW